MITSDQWSSNTHRQKGQINRKGCIHWRLETTQTQTQRIVIEHGGVTHEIGCGRRPECSAQRLARTPNQGEINPAVCNKLLFFPFYYFFFRSSGRYTQAQCTAAGNIRRKRTGSKLSAARRIERTGFCCVVGRFLRHAGADPLDNLRRADANRRS